MRRNLALTALLVTSCASKDVPLWMQAILDSRPHLKDVKGAHVHRSQYPEDLALKAAGALLAKPPVRNPVIVALTTTPTRVGAVEPAVRSLLNQSQPALIVVSIPDVYNNRRSHWNGKRIEPPAWLARLDAAARSTKGPCAPCVVVANPAHDYGPATKLVGAVSVSAWEMSFVVAAMAYSFATTSVQHRSRRSGATRSYWRRREATAKRR